MEAKRWHTMKLLKPEQSREILSQVLNSCQRGKSLEGWNHWVISGPYALASAHSPCNGVKNLQKLSIYEYAIPRILGI